MKLFWGFSLQDIAAIAQVATLVAAGLLIPYCLYALLAYEEIRFQIPFRGVVVLKRGNERIKYVHANRHAYYWPSLRITTRQTWWSFVGMIVVMSVVCLRVYLRYEDVMGHTPQPLWSIALSMFTSLVLLSILAQPPFALLWVKHQILGIHYGAREASRSQK